MMVSYYMVLVNEGWYQYVSEFMNMYYKVFIELSCIDWYSLVKEN